MNMVQNESTALIVASAGGSAAVVDLLLAKGANKNLQDKVCDMHHTLSDIRKCCCAKISIYLTTVSLSLWATPLTNIVH